MASADQTTWDPLFSGVPEQIGWRDHPSTYVVCTDDLAVHPDLERAMAERSTTRQEWLGGHSPMITRPGDVADLITLLATR